MFIALLLAAQVTCEWVEISQQHYTKPSRPTLNYPPLTTVAKAVKVERTTKANRIYINNSLPEYNWNKGTVFRVPVPEQLESSTVRHNDERNIFGGKSAKPVIKLKHRFNNDVINVSNKALIKSDIIVINDKHGKGTGHISRNNDVVHRVEVSNTENPRIIFNSEYKNKPVEVLHLSDLEHTTGEDIFTTIEIDDDITNMGKNKYVTKHVNSNIPTAKHTYGSNPETNRFATNKQLANKEITNQGQDYFVTVKGTLANGKSNEKGIKLQNINKVKRIQWTSSTETISSTDENSYERLTTIKDSKSDAVSANKQLFNNGASLKSTLQWHPNIGQIKRVQLTPKLTSDKNKLETSTIKHKNNEVTESTYVPNSITVTESSRVDHETKTEGYIHKVPNIGKIKRVHVTTEKTTTIKANFYKSKLKNYEPIKRDSVPNPDEVMMKEILKESEENLTDNFHMGTETGTIKRIQQVSQTQSNYKYNKPHIPLKQETLTFVRQSGHNVYRNNTENFEQVDITSTEEVPNQITKTVLPTTNVIIEREPASGAERDYPIKVLHESKPEFITKDDTLNNDQTSENDFVTSTINDDVKADRITIHSEAKAVLGADSSGGHEKPLHYKGNSLQPTQEKPIINNKIQETKPNETKENNTNGNTMENLVKFLKVVTGIISKNTRRGFTGKLQYLEDLRDSLLTNIEERIESAFPDDEAGASARRRRSHAHASPRGHVEFPSSESALMTISFLTFAVFLIKLVLCISKIRSSTGITISRTDWNGTEHPSLRPFADIRNQTDKHCFPRPPSSLSTAGQDRLRFLDEQVLQIYKNKTMMVPAVVATVGRAFGEYHSGP